MANLRLKKMGSKIETLSQEMKNTDLREEVDYNWEVDFILKNAQQYNKDNKEKSGAQKAKNPNKR